MNEQGTIEQHRQSLAEAAANVTYMPGAQNLEDQADWTELERLLSATDVTRSATGFPATSELQDRLSKSIGVLRHLSTFFSDLGMREAEAAARYLKADLTSELNQLKKRSSLG